MLRAQLIDAHEGWEFDLGETGTDDPDPRTTANLGRVIKLIRQNAAIVSYGQELLVCVDERVHRCKTESLIAPEVRAAAGDPVYRVRVWLEDLNGVLEQLGTAQFVDLVTAQAWTLVELERLRLTSGDRLDPIEERRAYAARLTGPGVHRTAWVFSRDEPAEWDDDAARRSL